VRRNKEIKLLHLDDDSSVFEVYVSTSNLSPFQYKLTRRYLFSVVPPHKVNGIKKSDWIKS